MRAHRLALMSGAGVLAMATPAIATTGNLYELGSSPTWATGSQFTSSVASDVWTVRAGALNPATAGSKWEMNWGCPAPGSVISQVKWSALRTGAASHMEMDVLAEGARVWATADANIPMAPAGGRAFDIGIAAGSCNVHLRLHQSQAVAQNARTYFIDHPRIVVRDLAPPSVTLDAVQQGWINGTQSHSEIRWTAADNFGSDGIGEQRVSIGGQLHYRGAPGAGSHALNAGVAPVGDGTHPVLVEVDGDGTGGGSASGALSIDRTPPSASNLSAVLSPIPATARFSVDATDATSGIARTEVQVNTATDGSATGQWRTIHTSSGAGVAGASAPAAGIADGVHAWRAAVSDHAGNRSHTDSPTPLAVDSTPPELTVESPGDTPRRHLSLNYRVVDNLQAVLGLGATEFAVNEAADATAAGRWIPLVSGPAAAGSHTAELDLGGLADGQHLLRVRARNGGVLGSSLTTEQTVAVRVDNSSPQVTNVGFRAIEGHQVLVNWIAQDASSGIARAVVQRRVGQGWQTLFDAPITPGAGAARVDVSGLDDGPVDLRLLIYDAAGNVSESRAAAGTTIDGTPPTVTALALDGPPWSVTWTQSDAGGGLVLCPTSIQVSGPGTAGAWREVVERRLPSGRHRVALPLAGLTPGAYRVRVVACDPSGNRGSAVAGGLAVSSEDATGAGSPGADAFARFRGSSLSLRVRGARVRQRGRQRTLVVRRSAGRRVVIEGRLLDRRRRPLGRVLLHARGHGGQRIGATRTGRDGRFRLRARPYASGPIAVGIPAGRHLIPRATSPRLRAVVAARVLLTAPRGRAVRGRAVTFSGRVLPSPARLGARGRKAVVLEWLDPLRLRWRPVVNGRTRNDGTFALRWTFGVTGLTIPMRVRVPAERGWPLRAGRSRVVRVTPG